MAEGATSTEGLRQQSSEAGYNCESSGYWKKIDGTLQKSDANVVGVESLSTNGFTDSAKHFHKDKVVSLENKKEDVLDAFRKDELKNGEIVVLDEGLKLGGEDWSDEDIKSLAGIIKSKNLKVALHLRPELGEEALGRLRTAGLNIGETQAFGMRQEDTRDIIKQKATEIGLSDHDASTVAEWMSRDSITVGEAVSAFVNLNGLMIEAGVRTISEDIVMKALESRGPEDCRERVLVFVGNEMRDLILKASEEKYGYEELSDREKALWQKGGYGLGILDRKWKGKGLGEIVTLRSPLLLKTVLAEKGKQNKLPQ